MRLYHLTPRQREIVDYIAAFRADTGGSPSLREIGTATGISSTNGVNDHLILLQAKGWLTKDGKKSRSIRLTDAAMTRLFGYTCLHCAGTGRTRRAA